MSLIEKYTAWAKYSKKYTAQEVLTEIIADLKWLEEEKNNQFINEYNLKTNVIMKKLFINVRGEKNTGKTTITYLIKEFLKKEGFDVNLNFSEEYCPDIFDEDAKLYLYNKVQVLKKEIKIILEEKNIFKVSLPKVDPSKVKLLNEGIDPKPKKTVAGVFCRKCPHKKETNNYSSSWDLRNDWVCTKKNNKVIQKSVEWHEVDKIDIPEWCPLND